MTWRMPAETGPQERVWMAMPPGGYALGDTPAEAHAARSAWAAVASTIAELVPVTMLVDPDDAATAGRYLARRVDVAVAPLDDGWMRDIGPTFVLDEHGRLGAVDWVFNGWGGQDWARWEKDARVAAVVAELAGAERIPSPLVNEGGGIHVDGQGTVLLTETVQLDPGRNPGLGRADVEAELARTLGATAFVWLPRGLTRDAQRYGTRGHVDIVATFPAPGTVLVHDQRDPEHPDHAVCREVRGALAAATDARGRALEVVEVPAPRTLRDAEGFVDYSYINHLVLPDAVVVGTFDDPVDAEACEILAAAYPGRAVVGVDAREIFARGGGIHCITQQQPRAA